MSKNILQMISLTALICCFENISVANAQYCIDIKDKEKCHSAKPGQDVKDNAPCKWVDSREEIRQLEIAIEPKQNLEARGINCFNKNVLLNRSCTYQKTDVGCLKVGGCDWEGELMSGKGKCSVSGSKKKETPSPKGTSSTGASGSPKMLPSTTAPQNLPSPTITPSKGVSESSKETSPSVCSPRKTPAECADRSKEGKCFWKANFFGKGGKCLPVGSTVKK